MTLDPRSFSSRPGAARRTLTIGLVMVITLAAFEALATATVMPAARDDLGGTAIYGWAFSGFLLASLVGIAFAGEQSDRHGPARPFVLGLVFFSAGLTIAGFAVSMPMLIAGRIVQGLGAGVIPPIAYVAVGRGYTEAGRPRVLALFATAWVVPGLIGPGIAGAAAEFATWRLAFLGILPLVGLAFLLVAPSLKALGGGTGVVAPSRVPRAIQLSLGAALIIGGLTYRSPWLTPPLIVAGALLAIPAGRSLLPQGIGRARPGLPATVLGLGALNLAFFGADAFVPFLLTEVRGQSTLFAGLVITSTTVSWTAGSWIVERRASRWPRRSTIRWGQSFVAVGCLGFLALAWEAPVWTSIPIWMVAGLGMGLAYPSYSLLLLAAAKPEEIGAISASAKLMEALSAAAGAGVVGALVAAGDAGDWLSGALALGLVFMGVVALAGVPLSFRLTAVPATITSEPELSAAAAG